MPSIFAKAFGYYSVLNSCDGSPIPLDRLHDTLTRLQNHLKDYLDLLDRLTTRIHSGEVQPKTVNDKWGRALAERLAKHSTIINELWLGFEMALVDENASDIDFVPVTRDQIRQLVKKQKIKFYQLPQESDELRRECAALTAKMQFKLQELVETMDEFGLSGYVICESTEDLR